jgi:rare lipoprotein A
MPLGPILTESSFMRRVLYAIFIAVFFIVPTPAPAQNRTPITKTKSKKPTRVFYGQASFYANKFHGRKTASGELFNQTKLTCACNILPLGTWIKVTNMRNGRSAVVKINDRIHPKMKRIVDLSKSGAQKLGYVSKGLTRVKIELIDKKLVPR